MKKIVEVCFMCLVPFMLHAQQLENGNIPISVSSGGGQYEFLYANLMNKKKLDIYNTVGSPYLYEDWTHAHITVMGDEAVFEEVKVDILNNCLEIRLNGASRILDPQYFSSFRLVRKGQDTLEFVNGLQYIHENKRLTGFVKRVQAGKMNLLTRFKARLVQPGTEAKIVGQDAREKIVQSQEIYVEKNNLLNQIRSKKDLLELLKNKEKKVNAFIKENKINIKEDSDILKVLHFYNQA